MRELKFKEVDKKDYRVGCDDGILLKPFYTIEEEIDIVNDMKEKNQAIFRKFSKVVLSARMCTNIDFEGIDDKETYNICAENGLISDFEINLDGFTELDKIVERDRSIYDLVDVLFNKVNKTLDALDKDKINEFVEKASVQLKDENFKEVESVK